MYRDHSVSVCARKAVRWMYRDHSVSVCNRKAVRWMYRDHSVSVCTRKAVRWMYRDHLVLVSTRTCIGNLTFHFLACSSYFSVQLICHTLIQNLSQLLNITAIINGTLGSLWSCCLHVTAHHYSFVVQIYIT
jgi:hypothetical protein